MLKKLSWMLGLAISLTWLGAATPASAEKNYYSVQPELPANQIDKSAGYFDLKVKPNQEQTLYIKINNNGKVERTYDVNTNLATTADNGTLDYSNNDPKIDESLAFNIGAATTNTKKVVVAAKTTKRVPIKLKMPDHHLEGLALGGINVVQRPLANRKKSSGIAIQNQFAYTIAIKLREQNKITVKPKMNLLKVGAEQVNYQNYVIAQLQNPRAVIMNELKVTGYVTKKGSDKRLLQTTKKEMRMAPNSNFNFALGDGTKTLEAGKYTVHLKADSEKGKYKWNFTKDFTVSPARVKALSESTIYKPDTIKTTNWWLIGSLVAVIVALTSALAWVIYQKRRSAN
ncbi:DUF916 and DUF3324 domain-containing protein [Lactiplantibacillus songbeiensis]|uniref:DUF916 and DUF3324 domain-containing protein n=1 Tax=Lactiplantibacillus songbeiensis TaxID=2559920 RepID=A0ABW4C2U5_9LACO|nr:DUF916 and DUF3324 domain-containing protein [Lactiplantibacillus songbeiensis]